MSPDTILPLDLLRVGEWGEVADVVGEPAWVSRMAELGLRVGCRLRMLQPGQTCMLQVGGCKLCLRGDASSQIFVRPANSGGRA